VLELFLKEPEETFTLMRGKYQQQLDLQHDSLKVQSVWGNELPLPKDKTVNNSHINFHASYQSKVVSLSNKISTLVESLGRASQDARSLSESFSALNSTVGKFQGKEFVGLMQEFVGGFGEHLKAIATFFKQSVQGVWHYESLYTSTLLAGLTAAKKEKSRLAQMGSSDRTENSSGSE
jgi:hypothetical protein